MAVPHVHSESNPVVPESTFGSELEIVDLVYVTYREGAAGLEYLEGGHRVAPVQPDDIDTLRAHRVRNASTEVVQVLPPEVACGPDREVQVRSGRAALNRARAEEVERTNPSIPTNEPRRSPPALGRGEHDWACSLPPLGDCHGKAMIAVPTADIKRPGRSPVRRSLTPRVRGAKLLLPWVAA